jgi:two-component system, NtrC family, sensor kinase
VNASPTSETEQEPRRATVLIVDDDDHVRGALRRALGRSRLRLLEAVDGKSALDVLSTNEVHVLVSDHRMPGMSGVELLRTVKLRWPLVQRVLLTGHADMSAVQEAVNQSEVFRLMWKPWDHALLLLTVEAAVDQHALVKENARLAGLLTQRNEELERSNRDLDRKLESRSRDLVRASNEWRACFDAIRDPLAILRDGCEVVRANREFAARANLELKQLPGARCRDGRFGDLPCGHAIRGGGELGGEQAFTVAGRVWVVRSFPSGNGGAVLIYKDVTVERTVQRRLRQTEKMAAVGQLAGGVAHEINNPLGGILAFSQIMSRDVGRSAEDVEQLEMISQAAIRAKRIVESLLRFSRRPTEDERRDVDLARVADEATFLLHVELQRARVEVVRRLEPAIAHGNANELQQVAVNLLVNAMQAVGTSRSGKITVRTGPGPAGMVRLAVLDDGPGVPPQVAERIFEPFFTTKQEGEGTGLGLSICYRIVEEHGGLIHHEPAPGGGACFMVDLPCIATTKS